jgi:hypothetical protein
MTGLLFGVMEVIVGAAAIARARKRLFTAK